MSDSVNLDPSARDASALPSNKEWQATAPGSQISLTISSCYDWTVAVQLQVSRVAAAESLADLHVSTDMRFLVVSLDHVRRSATYIQRLLSAESEVQAIEQALRSFDLQVPDVNAMRGMVEHADEYRAGMGDLQQPGVYRNRREMDEEAAAKFAITFLKRRANDVTLHLGGKQLSTLGLSDASWQLFYKVYEVARKH